MLSIVENMDAYDIAQEIRMERQFHKGSFLLFEGITDLKRLSKFLDGEKCSTVNCFGKPNVVGAVEMLYDEGFIGVLGIADADFDRILKRLPKHEGLIFSVAHDFDLDWSTVDNLTRYLEEVGDSAKCAAFGGPSQIRSRLLAHLKPLSLLRFFNDTQKLRLDLNALRFDGFVVGLVVDVELLVDAIASGRRLAQAQDRQTLATNIRQNLGGSQDLEQLTNGHDFFELLGLALRNEFGDRRGSQTWGREVAMHLRLNFSDADFLGTSTCIAILEWEKENRPYEILAGRIRSAVTLQ